jgi:hypothetical protein
MAMTKRRFLTPEEIANEDLGELPAAVRFTAIVLRMWADDEGRARLNVRSIKGASFANDPTTSEDDLTTHVLMLEEVGFLRTYVGPDDRQYFQVRAEFHTPPEKPKQSTLPPPPAASGSHPDGVPIEGGRGEGGSSGDAPGGAAGPDPDGIPSPFCPEHAPTNGTGGAPCRACGDARMAHASALRRLRHRDTSREDD